MLSVLETLSERWEIGVCDMRLLFAGQQYTSDMLQKRLEEREFTDGSTVFIAMRIHAAQKLNRS